MAGWTECNPTFRAGVCSFVLDTVSATVNPHLSDAPDHGNDKEKDLLFAGSPQGKICVSFASHRKPNGNGNEMAPICTLAN